MIVDPVKMMPPELVQYAQDIDDFKASTGTRLFWPAIGVGGGGTVVAAEDAQGNALAIKIIVADSDAMKEQVEREADILKRVQHAAALGGQGLLWKKHYRDAALCFLAMELVDGQTLAEYLAVHGPLDEALALEWAIAIAEALEALHRQKIIHRDIKPENIVLPQLGSHYQPIVVDYGIAKVGNHTARGARAATDGYAPPEQYKGGTDRRSDGYALGATLYEMMTGRTPPKATKRDPRVPLEPCQLNAALSTELELVIQVATACDPDHRFPSMNAMLDALRLVQSGNKAVLLSILQAMGLVTASSNGLMPVSISGAVSVPQLPPLPMKQPTPKVVMPPPQVISTPVAPTLAPVSSGKQQGTCPHCNKPCRKGDEFCDDCGYALTASVQVGASPAKAVPVVTPVLAMQVQTVSYATPSPQFLSLLLAQRILLGGPLLADWEKLLLIMAYWLMLTSLAIGSWMLSLALMPASSLAVGCFLVFLLLFPIFGKIFWNWKSTVISRRGQVRMMQRSIALLCSLAAIVATLAWCLREALAGHSLLAWGGFNASLIVCACLAGFAYALVKALLA